MVQTILSLDTQFTNFINSVIPHNQLFDLFFSFFSFKGSSFLIWIIIILAVTFIEELFHPGIQKRDIKFIFVFLICFMIAYLLSDILIKNIVQRPRPITTYSCPKDFSFPSTHATTAFAVAVVLSYFDKKRKWFYYMLAIVISISRIYLSCHYFIDVFIGGLLGFGISRFVVYFLTPRFFRRSIK